mmetsp:Transcript_73249/g.195340  ORF Transcript_73249/g.195340 Transcript_73249/m.195340 type:complete len:326 (+) Transcript_73249:1613-2590(+)
MPTTHPCKWCTRFCISMAWSSCSAQCRRRFTRSWSQTKVCPHISFRSWLSLALRASRCFTSLSLSLIDNTSSNAPLAAAEAPSESPPDFQKLALGHNSPERSRPCISDSQQHGSSTGLGDQDDARGRLTGSLAPESADRPRRAAGGPIARPAAILAPLGDSLPTLISRGDRGRAGSSSPGMVRTPGRRGGVETLLLASWLGCAPRGEKRCSGGGTTGPEDRRGTEADGTGDLGQGSPCCAARPSAARRPRDWMTSPRTVASQASTTLRIQLRNRPLQCRRATCRSRSSRPSHALRSRRLVSVRARADHVEKQETRTASSRWHCSV